MNTLICLSEQRREAVRQHTRLNGLDYLEVGSDQRTLTVYFLGKAPVSLDPIATPPANIASRCCCRNCELIAALA